MTVLHVASFSGGKDSTAMVLEMCERGWPIDVLWITPTGDELPDMVEHWNTIAGMVGLPLTQPTPLTLDDVIRSQGALPNHRIRFCTRMIKIQPAIDWVKKKKLEGIDVIMYVGLRVDEESRDGIYGRSVVSRYPLREIGMDLVAVQAFLAERNILVPRRTDCARCYHQRLGEWWNLWKDHREIWLDAERQEAEVGHTFRSPGRDKWPVALADLRSEFERGRVPRGADNQLEIYPTYKPVCRACSL